MRWTALLLAGLLALAPPAFADSAGNASSSPAQVKARLSQLRQHIDALRQQIAADTHQRSDLSDALTKARRQVSRTRHALDSLDQSIKDHEQRIARLKTRRDAERGQLGGRLDTLRAQVRAAYETGRTSRMRLLLSGASPARIGRMLAYYGYFSDAESRQVTALRNALADLADKQRALEQARQQLAAQKQTRQHKLARLKASEQRQQHALAALDHQLASHRSTLADMQADRKRLQNLLDQLKKQMSGMPSVPRGVPFYKLKGRMKPPVSGKRLASFGQLKNGGPLHWQGEWIAAPQGTPVRAVAGGRVVYVGYMKGYGLIVILDHGHGYYSLYGHAAASYVDVGDTVKTGETIATAGHSGGHERNGIYFEIRHQQSPVNPARWLAG